MLKEKEFIKSFAEHFCDIKEHRQESKIAYPLIELLFLAVVAVAARAESWEEIEEFGKAHIDTLREYLPFKNGSPSDCTIRSFITRCDSKQLNKVLVKYFNHDLNEKHYVIDGKTLRGSKYKDSRALHFLNVYAAESGVTLFGQAIDSKDNEITAIPEVIECLDIKNAIVTIDAMGCQKNIAKQIVEKEADYILGLKMNHPGLYNEVEKSFQVDIAKFLETDVAETYDKGHGRIEERKCCVIRDVKKIFGYEQWTGLNSVIQVKRKVVEKNKVSESVNYYISSSNNSAETMLRSIRSHWEIESMHWVLDVVFNEDASSIRQGNAPANMAIIRRFVLNILNRIKTKRETKPKMMLTMGWSSNNLKRFINALIKIN